jgi:hypothetical protein
VSALLQIDPEFPWRPLLSLFLPLHHWYHNPPLNHLFIEPNFSTVSSLSTPESGPQSILELSRSLHAGYDVTPCNSIDPPQHPRAGP